MQRFLIFLSIFIVVACSGCNNKRAVFERASLNAEKASEGFIRCHNYTQAWLKHADDKTGLIPRNLQKDSGIWNAKDAAADNYPFMVLSSFFTDHELFQGRMLDML